jgi:hypothetical protein
MDERGGMISFLWDINETRPLFGLIYLFIAALFEENKKYSITEHDQNFSSPSNKVMPAYQSPHLSLDGVSRVFDRRRRSSTMHVCEVSIKINHINLIR